MHVPDDLSVHALSLGSKTDTYIYNNITTFQMYIFYQMHEETFWRPMNLQDKIDYLYLEGQKRDQLTHHSSK